MLIAHSFHIVIVALLATVSASPTENIFGRAVGDSCKAKEGSGACQNIANCQNPPSEFTPTSNLNSRQGYLLSAEPLPQ